MRYEHFLFRLFISEFSLSLGAAAQIWGPRIFLGAAARRPGRPGERQTKHKRAVVAVMEAVAVAAVVVAVVAAVAVVTAEGGQERRQDIGNLKRIWFFLTILIPPWL